MSRRTVPAQDVAAGLGVRNGQVVAYDPLSEADAALACAALQEYSRMLRREAARRGMAGPALEATRARLRRDALAAQSLAYRLRPPLDPDPGEGTG